MEGHGTMRGVCLPPRPPRSRGKPEMHHQGHEEGTKNTKGSGGSRPRSSCSLFFFVSLAYFVVGLSVDGLFSAFSAVRAVGGDSGYARHAS